jgi:iron complex transport system permease protein
MKNISLGQYYPANSYLHKADPRIKIIIALVFIITSFMCKNVIGFVGLLAPHVSRILIKSNKSSTMLLSGLSGGCLLCAADLLARSVAATELPVSIFTSLVGAPFLVALIIRGRRQC